MEKFPSSQPETREQKIRKMLGLRDFPQKTLEEKKNILGSDQRVQVLDSIATTTHPNSKKEVKKGVVLEIAEKKLIAPEILEKYPIVYIGSGTDIEYPLALGEEILFWLILFLII